MKNIVLIGYGGMGKQHLKRIEQNQKLRVTGVYDIDKTKDYTLLNEDITIYEDMEQVLKDSLVDGVIIATPNDSHKKIAIAFLSAGKHVICEKPVTLNHLELEEIIEAAKKNNKIFMVNQNRRWDENVQMVRELIKEEHLGDIYYIENRVQGSRGIPADWRRDYQHGGGMLLDWGVHLIDRMLLLLNNPVKSIYCQLNYYLKHEVDDGFRLTLNFANGKRAYLEVGTSNFIELPEWYVVGSIGTAVIEDFELNGKYVTLTGELAKEAVPVETGAGLTKTMAPRNDDSIITHSLPVIQTNINEFYDNFADSIDNPKLQIIKNEQVLRVMKLIDDAFISAQQDKVIHYPKGI